MKSIIDGFSEQTVLIYGDFVLDEFLYGQIERISREAPVFIVSHQHSDFHPGCAANAAANLADMGAKVLANGVIGEDENGAALIEILEKVGVKTENIQRSKDVRTSLKTRVIAGGVHSTKQQIVRIDRLNHSAVLDKIDEQIKSSLINQLQECNAVLISDYGIGCLSVETAVWLLREAKKRGKPVMVDSRYRLLSYGGATAMTPNQPEVEDCLGRQIKSVDELHKAGTEMRETLEADALIITRGGDGMSLFQRENNPLDIPAFGDGEVVDVSGAGDTVISAMTLSIAAGADFETAAWISNLAGGLSVLKKGTRTVSKRELISALEQ